jgi:hypothetical protein
MVNKYAMCQVVWSVKVDFFSLFVLFVRTILLVVYPLAFIWCFAYRILEYSNIRVGNFEVTHRHWLVRLGFWSCAVWHCVPGLVVSDVSNELLISCLVVKGTNQNAVVISCYYPYNGLVLAGLLAVCNGLWLSCAWVCGVQGEVPSAPNWTPCEVYGRGGGGDSVIYSSPLHSWRWSLVTFTLWQF